MFYLAVAYYKIDDATDSMKKYMFITLLSASLSSLQAEPGSNPTHYSRQDTTLAIQKLFANKRSSGRILTMVGSYYLFAGAIALPVGAIGLVQTGFGLIRQTRFRRAREEAILESYRLGAELPKRIQRRLKAKYFPGLT